MPVMYAAAGNCHVYVHGEADLEMARRIAVNAKVQRPGVCNAAETLLIDASIAAALHPGGPRRSAPRPVSSWSATSGRARFAGATPSRRGRRRRLGRRVPRTEDGRRGSRLGRGRDRPRQPARHWALGGDHQRRRGGRRRFAAGVDAAAVYINASTRFTDGFEYGMGAEIGNSTQKLHARGPIGMRELTTFKYVARGDGQVRE